MKQFYKTTREPQTCYNLDEAPASKSCSSSRHLLASAPGLQLQQHFSPAKGKSRNNVAIALHYITFVTLYVTMSLPKSQQCHGYYRPSLYDQKDHLLAS